MYRIIIIVEIKHFLKIDNFKLTKQIIACINPQIKIR